MARRASDVAPAGPLALPATGLGRGWEPAVLAVATLLLLAFGLVSLYSASAWLARGQSLPEHHYVLRQAAAAVVGVVLLGLASRVPYGLWRVWAWPLALITFVLVLLTVLPGAEALTAEANGARRWVRVGPLTLQPSELAKFTVVVWTAMLAVRKQEQFGSLGRGLVPFLIVWALIALPVMLEPDLSTAFLIVLLGAVVVFAAGGRIGHFVFMGALALPVLIAQLGDGFRARRVVAFLNPLADPEGAGFQVRQSLIALGSGGLTGQGFGAGHQKFGFLPEPHNDFIFAMIGEEWGLMGVVVLVSLYLSLVLVGFRVARRAPDLFGQLLALGLTSLVAAQAFLHMAVGLAMVPATGLALPLVSFGRNNLVVTLLALGVLLSVARAAEEGWSRGS